jgi:putative PIN family toxin of toxin-antitoxin system
LKVFVDTNVHIAAFTGSQLCTELLVFVRQRHHLVVCPQVLDEFERGLIKKLKQSPAVAAHFRQRLERRCLVQAQPSGPVPKRSRDPKDDPILQAALDADCDWLVSGDVDLTSLKRFQGMPITTPRDFLEALGVEEPFV